MARLKTVRDLSAGGVVFRRAPGGLEIVLVGGRDPPRWGLPKGAPNRGESLEQAALREVAEETGLRAKLISPLGQVQYWFVLHGVRHQKSVHFYLMEAIGGDIAYHDEEHDAVEWFPLEEAPSRMSFANELRLVTQAEEMVARLDD